MSLAIPKSKRRKIIIIVIILSSRIAADLDNDILDTNAERLMQAVSAARPVFEINESNWSTEQEELWTQIESVADMIDPGDSENTFGTYADDVERALGNL